MIPFLGLSHLAGSLNATVAAIMAIAKNNEVL